MKTEREKHIEQCKPAEEVFPEHFDNQEGEVMVKISEETNPMMASVWDGDEMVHEPTATLQLDEVFWWADGYEEAKDKYSTSINEEVVADIIEKRGGLRTKRIVHYLNLNDEENKTRVENEIIDILHAGEDFFRNDVGEWFVEGMWD